MKIYTVSYFRGYTSESEVQVFLDEDKAFKEYEKYLESSIELIKEIYGECNDNIPSEEILMDICHFETLQEYKLDAYELRGEMREFSYDDIEVYNTVRIESHEVEE